MGIILKLKGQVENLENQVKILEGKLNRLTMRVDLVNAKPKELSDRNVFTPEQPYGVDATKRKIGAEGITEIDIEGVYFVQYAWYDEEGNETPEGATGSVKRIKKDENGIEMKSFLKYEEDLNKSNVTWDKDAKCWRFYAVFKPYEEEE